MAVLYNIVDDLIWKHWAHSKKNNTYLYNTHSFAGYILESLHWIASYNNK